MFGYVGENVYLCILTNIKYKINYEKESEKG